MIQIDVSKKLAPKRRVAKFYFERIALMSVI